MLMVVSAAAIVFGAVTVCVAPLTRFAAQIELAGIAVFIVGLATIGASIGHVIR